MTRTRLDHFGNKRITDCGRSYDDKLQAEARSCFSRWKSGRDGRARRPDKTVSARVPPSPTNVNRSADDLNQSAKPAESPLTDRQDLIKNGCINSTSVARLLLKHSSPETAHRSVQPGSVRLCLKLVRRIVRTDEMTTVASIRVESTKLHHRQTAKHLHKNTAGTSAQRRK